MKGLVLAGGVGTRLRPLTYTGAKQLVPVANKPILFYVIEKLVDAGIADVIVIISPQTGGDVRAALGDGARWSAKLTFIVQETPGGLAHAVSIAKAALGDDDFCMILGDNLIGSSLVDPLMRFRRSPELAALLMLKEVVDASKFGVAEVDAAGNVIGLAEKPVKPRSNLALVGIYFFRREIHDAIARIRPSPRGELEITDAISMLIERGGDVRFDRVETWWLDTGKKDDLLLANDTVLDDCLVQAIEGEVDPASQLIGRIRLERGASVLRSTIRGPTIIGAGARVIDSTVGPFTSVGENVTIERSGVEHSVLMEGSRISDIDRLEDSLVGRRVVVHPGASRPGAISLLVGDDCLVELARK